MLHRSDFPRWWLSYWLSLCQPLHVCASLSQLCGNYCGWTKSCTTLKPWEDIVRWYLQGNHSFQGFLSGAGFRPSTVSQLHTTQTGKNPKTTQLVSPPPPPPKGASPLQGTRLVGCMENLQVRIPKGYLSGTPLRGPGPFSSERDTPVASMKMDGRWIGNWKHSATLHKQVQNKLLKGSPSWVPQTKGLVRRRHQASSLDEPVLCRSQLPSESRQRSANKRILGLSNYP